MDITKIIAANLSAWMAEKPDLSTLKALEKASGVGFGTVRRAKNGDGNITVQNLELIARAFRRSAIELITSTDTLSSHCAQEPIANYAITFPVRRAADHPAIAEIVRLVTDMDEIGKGMTLERTRLISDERAQAGKANPERLFQ